MILAQKTVVSCLSSLLIIFLNVDLNAQNRIKVQLPTAEMETNQVWQTIRDIAFFEQFNYTLSLPDGPLIEALKKKSKNKQLNDQDFEALKKYMKSSVFKKSDYEAGYQIIEENMDLINKLINRLHRQKTKWDFKRYEEYQVNLTLYGSGGSYNPEEGSILLFTTTAGGFKNYKNPTNTILHEVIHIGIEKDIVQALKVPHPAKERIVDLVVQLNFAKYLPDYRLQGFGDARVNKYVKKKKDLNVLADKIALFMKENQFN